MERLNLLVVDSTSAVLKIALQINGKTFFFEQKEKGMNHLERLIPLIDEGIKELGEDKKALNYACVCQGAGSFTGIRIGIATILAIAFAGGFPALGFSVFDVYRYLYREKKETLVVPVVDAKKRRFYTTFLHSDDTESYDFSAEEIIDRVKKEKREVIFTGADFSIMEEQVKRTNLEYCFEYAQGFSSKNMLEAVNVFVQEKILFPPEPVYLRKSEAEIALAEKATGK